MKKKIGLLGGSSHSWVSVDRTRRYYIDALEEAFDLVYLTESQEILSDIDLVINFAGSEGWKIQEINCPRLLCIHGGAILDQIFLSKNLNNLYNQDGLIVNCDSDIEVIKSMCVSTTPEFFLLPLPVNDRIFYEFDKKTAKQLMGIDEETIAIGLICRLLPQKNPHRFVQILNDLKKNSNKKIIGFIVGNYWVDYPVLDYYSEEYPTYLTEMVEEAGLKDDIIFLPADLSDAELNCVYNAMNLIIHPTNSLDENFGYVPVEAMACGTPVVGAHYGGLKSSITPDVGIGIPTYTTQNGIRMDIKGSFSMIEALLNEENQALYSQKCLERVKSNYSFQAFKTNLIAAINQLIEDYNPNRREPISTVEFIDLNEVPDDLPETGNGINWNHYRKVVEKYVSNIQCEFEDKDYVYADCKYSREGNRFTRMDPAWPASYVLTDQEINILNRCSEKPLFYTECGSLEIDPGHIQQLINRGIVVLSKNEWR